MAVTLKQLSDATGFSVATISRVLNGDPEMSVSVETRQIIFDTAHKLGYAGGSGRRTQKIASNTMIIGIAEMIEPGEQEKDSYFLYLKNYVEHACIERKIQTISIRDNDRNVQNLLSKGIDGIIAIGYFTRENIELMKAISSNITFLDSSPDELLYDSVTINYNLGIKQAVDYLRELKHTRIGFIGPKRLNDDTQSITYEPRRRFFEHYMRELGMFRAEYVMEAPLRNRETVEQDTRLRFTTDSWSAPPTALITVNEECAIAVLHAMKNLSRSIPEDMSIISFNNTIISTVVEPTLTSIDPHLEYMANTAVRLVSERAASAFHQPERKHPQKVVIPPELIVRESTSDKSK